MKKRRPVGRRFFWVLAVAFGQAQDWAHTHFGNVALGDVRRSRRVVTLATGWARKPGATLPRLSQGQAYASKAAYQLLGHAQATPYSLQVPYIQHIIQKMQPPPAPSC